ncbi:MAG: MBL fold metallo-hydrolase [Methanotrichaceae archaeon]|nr:MBL fold metallo-hydrolase [Methanotrichaceae archaeon]
MSGPKRICSGVYVVGGPKLSHSYDCCVYLVDAGGELVLVDAGAGLGVERIEENMRRLGFDAGPSTLIATHCHIDHVGGMAALKERHNCLVIAHLQDRAGIEGDDPGLTAAGMYGLEYTPVMVDTLLMGEEEVLRLGDMDFHFLHTPGHTPGSISVWIDCDDGRVLFGQDIHGPFSPRWGSDMDDWRRSMEKLLTLDADILCEGHFGIYRGGDVRSYIESYLKRYGKA